MEPPVDPRLADDEAPATGTLEEMLADHSRGASIVARPGSPSTLAVSGDIDLSVSEWLSHELARQVNALPGVVTLDLSDVTFIDSSGVAALLVVSRTAEFRISAASAVARRVIEIAGLTDALGLAP